MKKALSTIVESLLSSQKRLSYRKMLVWLTGTGLFVLTDKLTAGDWLLLSMAYIGADAVASFAKRKPNAE